MSATVPLPDDQPTMSIWPEAGRLLGYTNRSSAYRAAAAGYLPTIRLSARRIAVPTAAVRQLLGLDGGDAR